MTVFEVFNQVVPKVKGAPLCTIFEAIHAVQNVIVSHLHIKRSTLLASDYDDKRVFSTGKKLSYLPDEFLGLSDRPYLDDDNKTRLIPLKGTANPGTETGAPRNFRIRGKLLEIYPVPTETTAVFVPFYARPPVPEEMDDVLPFWSMFDAVFVDSVVPVLSLGIAASGEMTFRTAIETQVDALLLAQELSDEQQLADSINGIDSI